MNVTSVSHCRAEVYMASNMFWEEFQALKLFVIENIKWKEFSNKTNNSFGDPASSVFLWLLQVEKSRSF